MRLAEARSLLARGRRDRREPGQVGARGEHYYMPAARTARSGSTVALVVSALAVVSTGRAQTVSDGAQGRRDSSAPASRFATRQNAPSAGWADGPGGGYRTIRATAGIGWAAGRVSTGARRKPRRRRSGPLRERFAAFVSHAPLKVGRTRRGRGDPGFRRRVTRRPIGPKARCVSQSGSLSAWASRADLERRVTHRAEKCCRSGPCGSDGAADSSHDRTRRAPLPNRCRLSSRSVPEAPSAIGRPPRRQHFSTSRSGRHESTRPRRPPCRRRAEPKTSLGLAYKTLRLPSILGSLCS